MPPSTMSLYIPYVFSNVTKDKIIYTFEFHLRLGHIKHVDLVDKIDKKGKTYYSAYIYFEEWYNNDKAARFVERIKNPSQETRVFYDTPEPWYWIVLENTSKKVVPGQRKLCIDVTDLMSYDYKTPEKNLSTIDVNDLLHLPSPIKKEDEEYDLYDISLNLVSEFSCGYEYDIEANLNDNDNNDNNDTKDCLNDIKFNLMYDLDIEANLNNNNDTKINVNKKDIIDLEYVKFLEQENMKLQGGFADAVDYFERCGLAEHRIRILEDELLCLRSKLSILEERGVVDPEVHY
jgi:hypothetical protein